MKIRVNGLGIVCRLGSSTLDIISNFKKKPILDTITVGSKDYPASITPAQWLPGKQDKVYELAQKAIDEAIENSGLNINEDNTGLIAGCTKGYSATISNHIQICDEPKDSVANTNQLNFDLSQHYHLPYNHIPNAACATGAQVLEKAINLLETRQYQQMIVCLSEASITNEIISAFDQLGVLTSDPKGMSPFDKNHNGFHIGDGAAAIILSKNSNNRKNVGFINAITTGTDATHFSEFKNGPQLIINLIEQALEKAELKITDIQHLNLHGTATAINDEMELLLMDHLASINPKLLFSSTKRHTGHLLGASGLLETVMCYLFANENWIPSLYISKPFKELSHQLVRNDSGSFIRTKHFLNVSYGLGSPIGIVLGESI